MFKPIDDYTKKIFDKKVLSRTTSLELIINEKCQNNCKYCYRTFKHNRSSLFSLEPENVKVIIDNFLNIIQEDKSFFNDRTIELYGGDPMLDYHHTREVFKIVDEYKPKLVTIPTNARLVSELTDYDIQKLFEGIETKIRLSLSVDGMPSENNRPLSKIGKMLGYNEKINYEKLNKVSKKYGYGFHPMLSFERIDSWLETIKFFWEEMNVIPYLLEVRHSLSKEDSIKAVSELMKIRDFYQSIDEKAVEMSNTLRASQVPRGLGCSALTTMCIMPNGDIPFCHRLVDPPWVFGNVHYGMDITKAISLTSIYNHRNLPECMICPIRIYCSGQCQGACYEYWGDPWIPIPSICDFNRLKAYIFSTRYEDWFNSLRNYNDKLKDSVTKAFGDDIVKRMMET